MKKTLDAIISVQCDLCTILTYNFAIKIVAFEHWTGIIASNVFFTSTDKYMHRLVTCLVTERLLVTILIYNFAISNDER